MLRSFRVGNHRSLRDEQELLLVPQYEAESRVLPVAAIYGANASGKSSFLDALAWMRSAVLDSFRVWEADAGIPRTRYRLDPDESKPSIFVADLILDGVHWVYGFGVTSDAVQEEWLYTYPNGRKRILFEREGQKIEMGSTLPERRSRTEMLSGLLRGNALLLSTGVQANQREFEPVYLWFRRQLLLPSLLAPVGHRRRRLPIMIAAALAHHPELVDLIKVADLGITGVTVEEPIPGLHQLEPVVKFLHGPDAVPMDLDEQSDGTLAWTELVALALDALRGGAMLVVDEIDASLHPRLCARLIELFRNRKSNTSGAQLLFTSHDAALLGTNLDTEVLRRDEIWFIKKREGASDLYALSGFKPRKGENRERRYLVGSYGAVPMVFEDTVVDRFLAVRAGERDDAA